VHFVVQQRAGDREVAYHIGIPAAGAPASPFGTGEPQKSSHSHADHREDAFLLVICLFLPWRCFVIAICIHVEASVKIKEGHGKHPI
jgi:hypothetical protein